MCATFIFCFFFIKKVVTLPAVVTKIIYLGGVGLALGSKILCLILLRTLFSVLYYTTHPITSF